MGQFFLEIRITHIFRNSCHKYNILVIFKWHPMNEPLLFKKFSQRYYIYNTYSNRIKRKAARFRVFGFSFNTARFISILYISTIYLYRYINCEEKIKYLNSLS